MHYVFMVDFQNHFLSATPDLPIAGAPYGTNNFQRRIYEK